MRGILKKRAEEVLNKFQDRKVYGASSSANFFGQESLGLKQVRGNGILVLTEDELYFEMLVPKKEFRIPLSNIMKLETPKSHLRKTKLRPLLKVVFKNDLGETDSAAWLLKDVHHWKKGIEKIIKQF